MKNKIGILILLPVLSILSCSEHKSGEAVVTGQQVNTDQNAATAVVLPSFNVHDANGQVINLQTLKGKKVFVNLWASWCPPCKREMPSIEKLYRSVDSNKVAFVLVSLDDRFEKAKQYIKSKKLHLPIYYPAQGLPELFYVQGIPATFIFNEKAELIKRIDGGEDYDTELYRKLLQ